MADSADEETIFDLIDSLQQEFQTIHTTSSRTLDDLQAITRARADFSAKLLRLAPEVMEEWELSKRREIQSHGRQAMWKLRSSETEEKGYSEIFFNHRAMLEFFDFMDFYHAELYDDDHPSPQESMLNGSDERIAETARSLTAAQKGKYIMEDDDDYDLDAVLTDVLEKHPLKQEGPGKHSLHQEKQVEGLEKHYWPTLEEARYLDNPH